MKVKSIMIPAERLSRIDYNGTVGQALDLINEKNFLSLPVTDGKAFKGMLSKRYIYEVYFNEAPAPDKAAFLARPVREMVSMKIDPIPPEYEIDAAAAIFISSRAPFIPVIEPNGDLGGIVTYQGIFKEYQKVYGTKYSCIVLESFDYAGAFAQVGEIVAKNGGNIKNVVLREGETQGVQEIHLRIDCEDIHTLVQKLEKRGYNVSRISIAEEKLGRQ